MAYNRSITSVTSKRKKGNRWLYWIFIDGKDCIVKRIIVILRDSFNFSEYTAEVSKIVASETRIQERRSTQILQSTLRVSNSIFFFSTTCKTISSEPNKVEIYDVDFKDCMRTSWSTMIRQISIEKKKKKKNR